MRELTIKNLTKSYGAHCVLQSVNLHYASGRIHGLIGDNGAGKSSFLSCLTGTVSYEGEVLREGINSVGILSADPYMYPRITGMEFIRFFLSAKNCKVDKGRISSLNELFQLPLGTYAENYSTGMMKKLYLLALILQENDLLLLDEPFNGLDLFSTAYVTELLKQVCDNGMLLIISSHELRHLVSFCDTISLVENKAIDYYEDGSDSIVGRIEQRAKEQIAKMNG